MRDIKDICSWACLLMAAAGSLTGPDDTPTKERKDGCIRVEARPRWHRNELIALAEVGDVRAMAGTASDKGGTSAVGVPPLSGRYPWLGQR